eukprot:1534631-Pyramimonas_sp.AAC.1
MLRAPSFVLRPSAESGDEVLAQSVLTRLGTCSFRKESVVVKRRQNNSVHGGKDGVRRYNYLRYPESNASMVWLSDYTKEIAPAYPGTRPASCRGSFAEAFCTTKVDLCTKAEHNVQVSTRRTPALITKHGLPVQQVSQPKMGHPYPFFSGTA